MSIAIGSASLVDSELSSQARSLLGIGQFPTGNGAGIGLASSCFVENREAVFLKKASYRCHLWY